MTPTTKEAAKPKKLTLQRKLGVVVGLVVFVVVAMVSIELSNPRPSLTDVLGRINRRELTNYTQVSKILGAPWHIELLKLNNPGVSDPDDTMNIWMAYDSSAGQVNCLEIVCYGDGSIEDGDQFIWTGKVSLIDFIWRYQFLHSIKALHPSI